MCTPSERVGEFAYLYQSEQPINDGEPASAKCPIQAGSADSIQERMPVLL